MTTNRRLGFLGRFLLSLSISSASAFIFVATLASSKPFSLMGKLGDETVRIIGHSGRDWFLVYFTLFFVPVVGLIELAGHTRFGSAALIRWSGVVSVVATPAVYWAWRPPNSLVDVLFFVLVALMVFGVLLHWAGKGILTQWLGLCQMVIYFGVFAWLFTKVMYLYAVLVIPIFGLASSLAWARDATLNGTRSIPKWEWSELGNVPSVPRI